MVRPRYWWRLPGFKTKAHSTPSTTQVTSARHHLSVELLRRLRGKCFRCLAPGHAAATCRDPVRCFSCGRWGHKSNVCAARSSPARQQPTPPKAAPPPLDETNFPPLQVSGMARPGDPSVRPLDTCVVALSVDSMDQELDRLSMHGMVAWLGGTARWLSQSSSSGPSATSFQSVRKMSPSSGTRPRTSLSTSSIGTTATKRCRGGPSPIATSTSTQGHGSW